jgi:hypothetical protein
MKDPFQIGVAAAINYSFQIGAAVASGDKKYPFEIGAAALCSDIKDPF